MVLLKDNILVHDYMNLVLVANGLKPATETGFYKSYGHNHGVPRAVSIDDERQEYALTKQQRLKEYKSAIEQFPLVYHTRFSEDSYDCLTPGCDEKYFKESVDFYIAKDKFSLNILLDAKSHTEKGLIYGFPWEAIKFFDDPNRRGFAAAAKMYYDIGQAVEANIPVPSWLAYISHVPEKTDFVNNDVSESSKALGEKYQSFIRRNHPDLAKLVEEDFILRIPFKTFINSQGHIVSEYNVKNENRKITLTL